MPNSSKRSSTPATSRPCAATESRTSRCSRQGRARQHVRRGIRQDHAGEVRAPGGRRGFLVAAQARAGDDEGLSDRQLRRDRDRHASLLRDPEGKPDRLTETAQFTQVWKERTGSGGWPASSAMTISCPAIGRAASDGQDRFREMTQAVYRVVSAAPAERNRDAVLPSIIRKRAWCGRASTRRRAVRARVLPRCCIENFGSWSTRHSFLRSGDRAGVGRLR